MATSELSQYWEEQLATWQSSGLSGQAFCEANSLVYHRFAYWRRKLITRRGSDSSAEPSRSGFARVTRVVDASVTESDSQLTVSLPGGIAITGLHAGNVSLLGDIMRQL